MPETDITFDPSLPKVVWDPADALPAQVAIEHELLHAQSELEYAQAHATVLSKMLAAYFTVGLVVGGMLTVYFQMGPFLLILGAVPGAIFYFRISSLQDTLIHLLIAQRQGWTYLADPDTEHWMALAARYPELMGQGDGRGEQVSKQFWGTIKNGSPFWSATYQFSRGTGKDRSTYYQTVYAFELPGPAAADFVLHPTSLMQQLGSRLSGKALQVESPDFNREFVLSYAGTRAEIGPKIFEVLNPAVLSNILDLRASCGPLSILFRFNTMIVALPGKQSLGTHTNFFKEVAVDPRDVEGYVALLERILSLGEQVVAAVD